MMVLGEVPAAPVEETPRGAPPEPVEETPLGPDGWKRLNTKSAAKKSGLKYRARHLQQSTI